MHALRNGGMRRSVKDGDVQEMMVDIELCREFISSIFNESWDDADFAKSVNTHLPFVFESLRRRKDAHLARALELLLRGSQPEDSSGRRNKGASAMAIGATVHHLHARKLNVEQILPRLNVRAFRIMRTILENVNAYRRLHAWMDITSSANEWGSLCEQSTFRQVQISLLLERLRAERRIFKSMYADPFRHNALFVCSDLSAIEGEIARLSNGWHAGAVQMIKSYLLRLQQGTRWALDRHDLEMGIRAPLSVVLNDIRRQARTVRMAVHDSSVEKEDVISADDVQRLNAIVHRIERFRNIVRLRPDRCLRKPVRSNVLMHLNMALRYASEHCPDWDNMKEEIDSALSVL